MDANGRKRWVEIECDEGTVGRLASTLNLHPLAARVLASRGLGDPADAERFLAARLADLPDPFTMAGMAAAVERLAAALTRGEKIALYGDYDVDGVTSTTLLTAVLRACGADPLTYVPHRLVEGYGLNVGAVEKLASQGVRLLVTLDCGITNVEEVRAAAARGLDTIVVDHHTVPVALPVATAILNPHQPGCAYPFKHLAAVGVTFCLAMALRKRLRESGWFGAARPEPNLKDVLDLVALGTVADVVPLVGVNRILVRAGLEQLERTRRPGLRALKSVAGIAEGAPMSAGQVGFRLGPRINAAGRLDDAGRGVRLLLTSDAAEAQQLARELDDENRARQEIEKRILDEALTEGAERVAQGARALVMARDGWHPGVVGIVASRIVEKFHRPAVLVGVTDGVGKGSGRSIEGFHLYDALASCAQHLSRFGGHKHAAGVTIDAAAVPAFRAALESYAREHIRDEDLVPRCRIEGRLPGTGDAERLASDLERLAPFGAGHPEPVFAWRGKAARARTVGAAGAHLKLDVAPGLGAIGFGLGHLAGDCAGEVEAGVTVAFDDWNGTRRVQLRIRDLHASEERGPMCVPDTRELAPVPGITRIPAR